MSKKSPPRTDDREELYQYLIHCTETGMLPSCRTMVNDLHLPKGKWRTYLDSLCAEGAIELPVPPGKSGNVAMVRNPLTGKVATYVPPPPPLRDSGKITPEQFLTRLRATGAKF